MLGPQALSSNPSGQGVFRLPYVHGPGLVTNDLTLIKNFQLKEGHNLQIKFSGFNFLNHPNVSFNNNDNSNLQLAFQGATAGKALTINNLTHQNFGIANIKYGARLLELSARYSF